MTQTSNSITTAMRRTQVAVSPAMNHGGPFPATGSPQFTAVGIPASISRWTSLWSYVSELVPPSYCAFLFREEGGLRQRASRHARVSHMSIIHTEHDACRRSSCQDNVRQERLPPQLQDKNPNGVMWRTIDGVHSQGDVPAAKM